MFTSSAASACGWSCKLLATLPFSFFERDPRLASTGGDDGEAKKEGEDEVDAS